MIRIILALGFLVLSSSAFGFCQVDRDCHSGFECNRPTNKCVLADTSDDSSDVDLDRDNSDRDNGGRQPARCLSTCISYCSNWGANGNCHGRGTYCGINPRCHTECTNMGANGNCHGQTDICEDNVPAVCR